MHAASTEARIALAIACWITSACASARPEPAPARDAAPASPTPTVPAPVADDVVSLFKTMGVTLVPERGAVEVSGWVNMQSGLVEVFACSPGGKTHESVVVLDCVPRGLHAALLAIGLQPGTPVEEGTESDYRAPTGDGVEIWVRWNDADGKPCRARAESWIWDHAEQRAMPASAWIFAGSFEQKGPDGSDVYAADYIKSLVTTYHDATSILENPLPGGIDDTLYYSNERAVPPVGTPVTVEFMAARTGS